MSFSTIVAAASGPGPAGVSIIRVSGGRAGSVLMALTGSLPPPRYAVLRTLKDHDGDTIDQALVLWFPAPASFTGEDVCELHVHGGQAVIADTIAACLNVEGVTLAKPGDFTRRAFENGKMDLSAAEGLGDLIEAETKAQRRQALRQMQGALALEVEAWRTDIIDALADAEGDIDFPDEDLPPGLSERARQRIANLRARLTHYLSEADRAVRIRDGFRIAILGVPNAGKSSLLNALAQRDAAIVSPIAGTTRDIIEVRLILSGLVIWLADTAGLHDATDQIEVQGIARARALAKDADLRLGVIAGPQERGAICDLMGPDDVWVLAKSDVSDWQPSEVGDILVSSVTGDGLAALEAAIVKRAQADVSISDNAPLTRLRHKQSVSQAIDALTRALNAPGQGVELIAEDLRLAARYLGQITGRVDMEDVLDRLFSQFCIGK